MDHAVGHDVCVPSAWFHKWFYPIGNKWVIFNVISKQHETVKHTAIMLRQKTRYSFPVMSSRTLKHNNSSACDSHPGGQGALGWLKCCGSWKSSSLWMLCLHSDKALKVLQFFTSHRPKAGPPDITTQPLPLTGARKRRMERRLHSFKHYSPML